MGEEILEKIKNLMVDLEIDRVKEVVQEALNKNIPPLTIIDKALSPAMEIIGEKYESGEYYLAELVVAGDTFKEVMEILKPHLKKQTLKKLGKVVIGTVRGDLHEIGKNIVATMLETAGFDVYDLGVDVPPEKFVEKAKEVDADIVALSALLTTTMIEMKNVVDEFKKAGLRDKVKIIVGGAPVTEEYARKIGADAYGKDAVEAVKICKQLVGAE